MANPRKFSERIALQEQKMAEGTAAFEAILKDVYSTTRQATTKQHGQPSQSQHLAQPSFGAYRGCSLPDVNQMASGSGSVDLQSALSSLENMKQSVNGHPPPDKNARHRNQQPPKKFLLDRHRDCSPYGSVYLSPPETSWRRSSSDSALHASVQASAASDSTLTGSSSMLMNRQGDLAMLPSGQSISMDTGQFWVNSKDGRPRSCEVPGISIYPSPDQGSAAPHIPISNNTGSLPDLANLNFPSPLTTPLDVETQNEQQHLQQVMRNVLPCYMTPVNVAMQPGQHQPTTSIPMVMGGTQQQVISVPPVILQGSNHLLLRGREVSGGDSILTQDNRFMSSLPGLSPDLPTPPPPPYPSSAPQVMSPPPMITVTDETTLNGDDGEILFAGFEQCLSKDNGPFSYFTFGNSAACNVQSTDSWQKSTNSWQNTTVSSAANMQTSLPFQSWPTNALDLACQSSDKQQFSQSTRRNQGTDSFKGTATQPARPHTVPSHSSTTKLSAADASNTDIRKTVPLIQSVGQYAGSITSCRSSSPLSSQSNNSSCSVSRSSGMTSVSAALPSISLSDVTYHPNFIINGPPMIYNEPQSLNSMYFNLSQVSRQPHQQASNSQQPHQNFILQQNCQQIGTTPVSGNITMYAVPTAQHQQQQPVILPTSNLVLMQTNTTTSSMPGITSQQLQQQEQLLYQEALLQSMNSQWNSNQQPPRPGVVGQIPVSQQQLIQYMNSKQPTSPTIPNIVLTAEDLLSYGHQTSDGRSTTGSSGYSGGDPLRECLINASTYLGDSFDAADMFTAEEFLTLGLDPLELDEIQMLSDASVVTDPATEDSFRMDRI